MSKANKKYQQSDKYKTYKKEYAKKHYLKQSKVKLIRELEDLDEKILKQIIDSDSPQDLKIVRLML